MQQRASAQLRIARPTSDLVRAERFWREGLGLSVLYRGEGPGHPRLLMLGWRGAAWHLELVEDLESAGRAVPTQDDLLVVYVGDALEPVDVQPLLEAGGVRVSSRNPYWDESGVTIEDPDGYRLVLTQRTWDPPSVVER